MPDAYLPPVIAQLAGDSASFIKTLTDAKALLAQWGASEAAAKLTADISPLLAQLAKARAAIDAFTAKAATVRVNVDTSGMGMTVGQSLLADMIPTRDLREGSGIGSVLAAAAGRGGGGMLRSLLLGGGGKGSGGIFGFGRGLPAFGSIGSILGLGVEHVGAMGMGVMGSAVGAGLGGGLLGLGAMGVMGVGMGTDMAGMGQALGDIKQYTTLQDNLNRAIAVYGANSKAAALAQYNMNQFLQDLTPAAQSAIKAASGVASEFHAMFDKLTGPAEAIGAQIITQAMKVGEAFLPTLGKFAAQNMGIIKKDIQPLFSWLQSPGSGGGLGIFTNLNKIFQSNLPTSIHAFTQFIEVLGNTINTAAGYTGGFIQKIDAFLTKVNTPSGLKKWDHDIGSLIGMFKTWMGFFGNLAKVIADVFGPAMGTGTAIIKGLSGGLADLDKWLKSSSMKESLHGLFGAHLDEVGAFGSALHALLPDVEGFIKGLIPVLTVGARFGAILLHAAASVLNFANKLGLAKIIPFATAIFMTNRALSPLINTIGRTVTMFGRLLTANPILLALAAAALLVYEAVTHWKQISAFVERIWHDVAKFFTNMYHDAVKLLEQVLDWAKKNWPLLVEILIGILLPGGPVIAAIIHFHKQITDFFVRIWHDVAGFVSNMWHDVTGFFSGGIRDVVGFFTSLPGKIKDAIGDAASMLLQVGKDIIQGLIHGIESMASKVGDAVKNVASGIKNVAKKILGIFSPSSVMANEVGVPIAQGIAVGILRGMPTVHASLGTLSTLARSAAVNSFAAIPSGGSASSPQLDRIERLMEKLVALQTQTVANTKATVDAAHGLSSPASVAAQIRSNNTQIVHSLRAGSVR